MQVAILDDRMFVIQQDMYVPYGASQAVGIIRHMLTMPMSEQGIITLNHHLFIAEEIEREIQNPN